MFLLGSKMSFLWVNVILLSDNPQQLSIFTGFGEDFEFIEHIRKYLAIMNVWLFWKMFIVSSWSEIDAFLLSFTKRGKAAGSFRLWFHSASHMEVWGGFSQGDDENKNDPSWPRIGPIYHLPADFYLGVFLYKKRKTKKKYCHPSFLLFFLNNQNCVIINS